MRPIINIADNYDSYVGVTIDNGTPYISFPYGFDLEIINNNPTQQNFYVMALLNTIITTQNTMNQKDITKYGGHFFDDFPLYDYIWIIMDYIERGVYCSREKKYQTKQKGKVNWKKTITGKFTISKNNVIYNDIIYETNEFKETEITNIHIYCLNKAYNIIGWLFGFVDIPHLNTFMSDLSEYIDTLNSKLSMIFDDRTKFLFNTMIRILKNAKSHENKLEIVRIGTNRFHIVWENIIDNLFSNTNINNYYPRAKYYLNDYNPIKANSTLRPDTLSIKDNFGVLIDSKYYKFGLTFHNSHLPPISDIQKQIIYGKYIYQKLEDKDEFILYNTFVLPYNRKKYNGNIMICSGYASIDWESSFDLKTYDKIGVILIDTNFCLKEYSKNNKNDLINDLLKLLRHTIKI